MNSRYQHLKSIDFRHLWHPFTQHALWQSSDPIIIERAEGSELVDVNGRRYLDGVSSLWCNVHGHSVPELLLAIQNQSTKLCHATLLGVSHVPVLELIEELLPVLPEGLSRIFFSDSGTAGVEAALRMALEWQAIVNPNSNKRKRFVSLVNSYHGDTLGSISVGYEDLYHRNISHLVQPAFRLRPPICIERECGLASQEAEAMAIDEARRFFAEQSETVAACIVEPRVQGAAGMLIHSERYLQALARLCREHDVLLIADEVATGFGKTGKMFAVQTADVFPDLLVMGKGLTAGYLPMSAVAVKEEIYQGFCGALKERKAFYFGQTFSGNPLAARVAKESLALFREHDLLAQIADKTVFLRTLLEREIEPLAHVYQVRQLGFMTGIELTKTADRFEPYAPELFVNQEIVKAASKRGAIIRPLGNVMVIMPPLAMTHSELEQLLCITAQSIKEVTERVWQ